MPSTDSPDHKRPTSVRGPVAVLGIAVLALLAIVGSLVIAFHVPRP